MKPWLAILAVASVAVPTTAEAALSISQTTRDTLSVPFIPGDGNSNEDFAITRIDLDDGSNDIDIEIGLKAKERFVGQKNVGGSGTTYIVQPGFSPTSGTDPSLSDNAWWNFDFSIDLGSGQFSDFNAVFSIENPEGKTFSGSTNEILGTSLLDGNSSLYQGSQNIGFFPFEDELGEFKPFLYGNYDIGIEVFDAGGSSLGSQEIIAQVVPLPAAAALFVPGLVSIALVARRRQNRAAA